MRNELVDCRIEAHRHDHLMNQLGCLRPDDRSTEDSAVFAVGHHLYESFRLGEALRFAVFGKIVPAADISDPFALQFLLAHSHCGDLRIGEDRVGADEPVIANLLGIQTGIAGRDLTLVDCNVNEHILTGNVANRVHFRVARAHRAIDRDSANGIMLDSGFIQAQAGDVGYTAKRVKISSPTASDSRPSRL